MEVSSWFRQTLSWKKKKPEPSSTSPTTTIPHLDNGKEEEEQLGLTEQLRDFLKSFTLETFKNFPLLDDQATTTADESPTTSTNVRKDLSEWQEQHATLVLSKVKEISQLRFVLCPRHLKERQFWRIYFMLVKSYVSPYEMRAIRNAKLKRMGMKDEKSSDASAFEVEMAEAKQAASLSPLASSKHDLDSLV
ncbi:hypothetical protein HHK36_013040 [Tetracentron sinense]|uniref:BSD domain-containing protein n=1 Tax=Tetracentron sinense TaxID=13715 RepID=A0A835DG36_TETSI|nr:hypothetical protein HHK36_013040 [Tetracentron sinense]